MVLDQVRLYNFRSFGQLELRPDPKFNVIIGLNGQGKTNLLEAIGLLTQFRSFRGAKNSEMLKLGEEQGNVSGMLRSGDLEMRLDVRLWPARKQGAFNGKPCRYLSEYVGRISAVSFSPADLGIIKGSPENRRNWLDRLAQLHDPTHADQLSRYQKTLEHRNRYLKEIAEGRVSKLPEDFEIWTDELIARGSEIIHKRVHSVDKCLDKIGKFYSLIAGKSIDLSIQYSSGIFETIPYGQRSCDSLELINRLLRESLDKALPRERLVGTSLVGPHRDDAIFEIAGRPVRTFGSQGEIRAIVLALRLTEVEISRQSYRASPILLIDDFSSELDAKRREFLLDHLLEGDSQVFLSTTEEIRIGKRFLADKGSIASWSELDDGYVLDRHQQL